MIKITGDHGRHLRPQQETILLAEAREILDGVTNHGANPVRVAFMCLMASHTSPRMRDNFIARTSEMKLGNYFHVESVPWGMNPYDLPPNEETHVINLSKRLSDFDVILPFAPKEGGKIMEIHPWISAAVDRIPEHKRPSVIPFIIEDEKDQSFVDLVDKKDYGKVLEELLVVLKQRITRE